MNKQIGDRNAKGGDRHGLRWADHTYLAPGLHWRHHRIIAWPFSVWWHFRRINALRFFVYPLRSLRRS